MGRNLRKRIGSCLRGGGYLRPQEVSPELQMWAPLSRRSAGRKGVESLALTASLQPPQTLTGSRSVGKKKTAGTRLWMRFDKSGASELVEYDRSAIIKRTSIPPRDLRVLGPLFSHSSNILARDKTMVVNLEFIKAIITSEELLLLDPLSIDVLPFVNHLKNLIPLKPQVTTSNPDLVVTDDHELDSPSDGQLVPHNDQAEVEHVELPFEFQVLEIALEVVCAYLHSSVSDLEKEAYPALDELTKNVSKVNLENIRSIKGKLTRLLARVQKVRDEIEHLLDDDEDMSQLYLTRKKIENAHFEALITAGDSDFINTFAPTTSGRTAITTHGSAGRTSYVYSSDRDVEALEMLLESYFMQLDGTQNKILSVREYIDDTEDYVNIQLDNQRNELIELHLVLTMYSFAFAFDMFIIGSFSINIPCSLYNVDHLFTTFVVSTSSGCFFIFLLMLAYARWKKLIGS